MGNLLLFIQGGRLGLLFLTPCGPKASFSQLFLNYWFYSVSQHQWEPLAFLPFSASVTQGGAGSPPPLVEVNQAILAWSFYLIDKPSVSICIVTKCANCTPVPGAVPSRDLLSAVQFYLSN